MHQRPAAFRPRERGIALIVALIVLASVSMLALGSLQATRSGLLISANDVVLVNTFQTSQAALDFASSDLTNLPTSGPLNVPQQIALEGSVFQTSGSDQIVAAATRTADCVPPPRARTGSSLIHFSAFHYDVNASVDLRGAQLGRANTSQGYIVLGPKCL
jgi:Tfp pilus assembly protein PilX